MKRFTIALMALLALSSLAEAQMNSVLKDTRYLEAPLEKIVFITQLCDEAMRNDVEMSVESALAKKQVDYINAYDLILPDTLIYYSTLEREFFDAGADGVLIIKLVDVDLTDMYIIPGGVLPPDAYNYYEYYSVYHYYDLPVLSDSGYLQRTDRVFRLDANLYQGKGDMIIWSVQSDPINMQDYAKALGKFTARLAKGLLSEKLVLKQK